MAKLGQIRGRHGPYEAMRNPLKNCIYWAEATYRHTRWVRIPIYIKRGAALFTVSRGYLPDARKRHQMRVPQSVVPVASYSPFDAQAQAIDNCGEVLHQY